MVEPEHRTPTIRQGAKHGIYYCVYQQYVYSHGRCDKRDLIVQVAKLPERHGMERKTKIHEANNESLKAMNAVGFFRGVH